MIMKHAILSIALAAGVVTAAAQGQSMSTTTADGRTVTVTAVTDNIIKVSNLGAGEKAHHSRSVVLSPSGDVKTQMIDDAWGSTMSTPTGVIVTLDKLTGGVNISAGGNRSVSDDGVRTICSGRRELSLSTMGAGSFYGAGERGYNFNLAGDTLVMYNKQNYGYTASDPRIRQMNITMPLFVSSAGYAVLFDDYAAAEMIMSNPIKYITESPDPVDYYFINGSGSLASVAKEYTALTGRQPLSPFWALGYITSKYGYKDEAETRGVVDTLKRAGYPLDGIVLDLYWYGKEEDMGRLTWDPEQWPQHKKMLADLKAKGVNLVAISQPYVLRNGRAIDNYNELAPRGMFVADSTGHAPQDVKIWVGEGGMFDVSNPDTRAWLAERYRQLTVDGVTGWWGDLGEPEVHPETALHANGLTARQYHNQYGNDWSEIIADMFAKEFPDTRLMTMMRGGTAGLQRYSVYPWSTDVSRSWGGLQPQVVIMLNSGLSGLGYMSHDVGGFAVDPENPKDPELYVRWLQLGTFSPILRTHAQQEAEPYKYPEQQSIILPLIKERYRWLPYNYTLAYENASQGLPLVRPLNFYMSGSNALDTITDQYLWGRDVMIAPVLTQGTDVRKVTFPAGTWLDVLNPANIYQGGETIDYPAPLEVLPMFVRAGAFIPTADYKMTNTGDYDPSRYTVNYYPAAGVSSEYTMYEDDRTSNSSLADGKYALIKFVGTDNPESIDIKVSQSGSYTGMPARKSLTFKVYGVQSKPASVTIGGKKVSGWKYDSSTATLTIPAILTSVQPIEISIVK